MEDLEGITAGRGPPILNFIIIYYGQTYENVVQDRTISEEFDFLMEEGGWGRGSPFINYILNYYWQT